MLQQTQVERVVPKFESFMKRFPSFSVLANSSLAEVLASWQGLGYNRRAKYLHEAAKSVVQKGHFPTTVAELTTLPGIGENTAGAIYAYVYNLPVVYVETNIRTVYLYHFFNGQTAVSDEDIRAKIAETLPNENFRQWYEALMDYGAHLKSNGLRNVSLSKHYVKQTPFSGSVRQVRGAIIRGLVREAQSLASLKKTIRDPRLPEVLAQLEQEKLIVKEGKNYTLPG